MIRDMHMDNDVRIVDEIGTGRSHHITGIVSLEVSMVFRGDENLSAAIFQARNMGEADGLRHIAAAIDALDESTPPMPDPRLPDYRSEPEPEPREVSTGRRNLQIE